MDLHTTSCEVRIKNKIIGHSPGLPSLSQKMSDTLCTARLAHKVKKYKSLSYKKPGTLCWIIFAGFVYPLYTFRCCLTATEFLSFLHNNSSFPPSSRTKLASPLIKLSSTTAFHQDGYTNRLWSRGNQHSGHRLHLRLLQLQPHQNWCLNRRNLVCCRILNPPHQSLPPPSMVLLPYDRRRCFGMHWLRRARQIGTGDSRLD
jgi:hypothetical protein